jgi:hypothetical protein
VSPEAPFPGGAAVPHRSPLTRRLALHALGLLAAGLLTWLVWRGYRQPGFILELANAMVLC